MIKVRFLPSFRKKMLVCHNFIQDQDCWVGDKVLYYSETASYMTFMFIPVLCPYQVPWGLQERSPKQRSEGFSLKWRDLELKKLYLQKRLQATYALVGIISLLYWTVEKIPAPEGRETRSLSSKVYKYTNIFKYLPFKRDDQCFCP